MYSLRKKRRKVIDKVELGKDRLDTGIEYDVFSTIPKELKLSLNDIGKQVWVACEPRSTTCILRKIHNQGEERWPKGGYEVELHGTKYRRSFFPNEVILHPDEIKLSKKEKDYNKGIRKAKKQKYKNPLTGRKCSYKYSLDSGFITEMGDKIPLKDMKFENPETGREVSYSYAKQKGII